MITHRLRLYVLALMLAPAQALAADAAQAPSGSPASPSADKADTSATDARQLARTKAQEGLALYLAERWQEAYQRFVEADRLHHAPTLTLYLARCQRKLGKPAEARALYGQLLAEPLAKDAPPQYAEARRDAERELAQLQAEPSTRPADAPLAPRTPPPRGPRGSLLPAGLALGIGGVSLGVGAVTGILSLGKVSNLESSCPGYHCSPALQSEADSAATLGNISTAAFIVGTAAAATGVVLLIIRPGGGAAPATTGSAARADPGVRWSAGIGAGRLNVRAEF
jgi:hypothetical protein